MNMPLLETEPVEEVESRVGTRSEVVAVVGECFGSCYPEVFSDLVV